MACTALTGQNIQVTWKPPPSDKVHGVVQGYKLLYEAASGVASESQTGRETKISHALSTVLHGLSPYTNYTVQVLAYTKAGEGVSSSPVSCTTEETGKLFQTTWSNKKITHRSFINLYFFIFIRNRFFRLFHFGLIIY